MRKRGAKTIQNSDLMTSHDVAEFLRTHVSSVRRWTRQGRLKGYRLGGTGDWRYSREDVLAFVFQANHINDSNKSNDFS